MKQPREPLPISLNLLLIAVLITLMVMAIYCGGER